MMIVLLNFSYFNVLWIFDLNDVIYFMNYRNEAM